MTKHRQATDVTLGPQALLGVALTLCLGCVAKSVPPTLGLIAEPATVRLDAVRAGGRANARVSVRNTTANGVTIAKLTTTCDCVSVDLVGRTIRPGSAIEADVVLDLAKEPDFVGKLAVGVEALTADGAVVLQMDIFVNAVAH